MTNSTIRSSPQAQSEQTLVKSGDEQGLSTTTPLSHESIDASEHVGIPEEENLQDRLNRASAALAKFFLVQKSLPDHHRDSEEKITIVPETCKQSSYLVAVSSDDHAASSTIREHPPDSLLPETAGPLEVFLDGSRSASSEDEKINDHLQGRLLEELQSVFGTATATTLASDGVPAPSRCRQSGLPRSNETCDTEELVRDHDEETGARTSNGDENDTEDHVVSPMQKSISQKSCVIVLEDEVKTSTKTNIKKMLSSQLLGGYEVEGAAAEEEPCEEEIEVVGPPPNESERAEILVEAGGAGLSEQVDPDSRFLREVAEMLVEKLQDVIVEDVGCMMYSQENDSLLAPVPSSADEQEEEHPQAGAAQVDEAEADRGVPVSMKSSSCDCEETVAGASLASEQIRLGGGNEKMMPSSSYIKKKRRTSMPPEPDEQSATMLSKGSPMALEHVNRPCLGSVVAYSGCILANLDAPATPIDDADALSDIPEVESPSPMGPGGDSQAILNILEAEEDKKSLLYHDSTIRKHEEVEKEEEDEQHQQSSTQSTASESDPLTSSSSSSSSSSCASSSSKQVVTSSSRFPAPAAFGDGQEHDEGFIIANASDRNMLSSRQAHDNAKDKDVPDSRVMLMTDEGVDDRLASNKNEYENIGDELARLVRNNPRLSTAHTEVVSGRIIGAAFALDEEACQTIKSARTVSSTCSQDAMSQHDASLSHVAGWPSLSDVLKEKYEAMDGFREIDDDLQQVLQQTVGDDYQAKLDHMRRSQQTGTSAGVDAKTIAAIVEQVTPVDETGSPARVKTSTQLRIIEEASENEETPLGHVSNNACFRNEVESGLDRVVQDVTVVCSGSSTGVATSVSKNPEGQVPVRKSKGDKNVCELARSEERSQNDPPIDRPADEKNPAEQEENLVFVSTTSAPNTHLTFKETDDREVLQSVEFMEHCGDDADISRIEIDHHVICTPATAHQASSLLSRADVTGSGDEEDDSMLRTDHRYSRVRRGRNQALNKNTENSSFLSSGGKLSSAEPSLLLEDEEGGVNKLSPILMSSSPPMKLLNMSGPGSSNQQCTEQNGSAVIKKGGLARLRNLNLIGNQNASYAASVNDAGVHQASSRSSVLQRPWSAREGSVMDKIVSLSSANLSQLSSNNDLLGNRLNIFSARSGGVHPLRTPISPADSSFRGSMNRLRDLAQYSEERRTMFRGTTPRQVEKGDVECSSSLDVAHADVILHERLVDASPQRSDVHHAHDVGAPSSKTVLRRREQNSGAMMKVPSDAFLLTDTPARQRDVSKPSAEAVNTGLFGAPDDDCRVGVDQRKDVLMDLNKAYTEVEAASTPGPGAVSSSSLVAMNTMILDEATLFLENSALSLSDSLRGASTSVQDSGKVDDSCFSLGDFLETSLQPNKSSPVMVTRGSRRDDDGDTPQVHLQSCDVDMQSTTENDVEPAGGEELKDTCDAPTDVVVVHPPLSQDSTLSRQRAPEEEDYWGDAVSEKMVLLVPLADGSSSSETTVSKCLASSCKKQEKRGIFVNTSSCPFRPPLPGQEVAQVDDIFSGGGVECAREVITLDDSVGGRAEQVVSKEIVHDVGDHLILRAESRAPEDEVVTSSSSTSWHSCVGPTADTNRSTGRPAGADLFSDLHENIKQGSLQTTTPTPLQAAVSSSKSPSVYFCGDRVSSKAQRPPSFASPAEKNYGETSSAVNNSNNVDTLHPHTSQQDEQCVLLQLEHRCIDADGVPEMRLSTSARHHDLQHGKFLCTDELVEPQQPLEDETLHNCVFSASTSSKEVSRKNGTKVELSHCAGEDEDFENMEMGPTLHLLTSLLNTTSSCGSQHQSRVEEDHRHVDVRSTNNNFEFEQQNQEEVFTAATGGSFHLEDEDYAGGRSSSKEERRMEQLQLERSAPVQVVMEQLENAPGGHGGLSGDESHGHDYSYDEASWRRSTKDKHKNVISVQENNEISSCYTLMSHSSTTTNELVVGMVHQEELIYQQHVVAEMNRSGPRTLEVSCAPPSAFLKQQEDVHAEKYARMREQGYYLKLVATKIADCAVDGGHDFVLGKMLPRATTAERNVVSLLELDARDSTKRRAVALGIGTFLRSARLLVSDLPKGATNAAYRFAGYDDVPFPQYDEDEIVELTNSVGRVEQQLQGMRSTRETTELRSVLLRSSQKFARR